MTVRLFSAEGEAKIAAAIAADAERDGIYFVRVSRQLADKMSEWSPPVQVRFEIDSRREGEGVFIVREVPA